MAFPSPSAPHEILGLLGPNGAGKTTTINMILGVLEPTSGSITIDGCDLAKRRRQALGRTNFAAVYAPLPGNLTVAQNLRVFGMLYAVPHLRERIETILREFDLIHFRDTKCGVLSSGEQTRVALAKAMLNQPRLLLLDEPTASLDPSIAREIRATIRDFADAHRRRRALDLAQHDRSRRSLPSRAVSFARQDSCSKAIRAPSPPTTATQTLEDLFVAVAREPLTIRNLQEES